jgi:riboflavin synthase
MFTGLILKMGKLVALEKKDIPVLKVKAELPEDLKIGDSLAVNGACLTIVDIKKDGYAFNVSRETLRRSHFADLSPGSWLNLELPLTLKDFLGGHLVSGHLDGTARIKSISRGSAGTTLTFVFNDKDWRKFLIAKGSVCLNGISLTISAVRGSGFSVEVIPHTMRATNLKYLKVGERVNLELDLVGKYIYNFISKKI